MLAKLKSMLPVKNTAGKPKSGSHFVALDIGTENIKALICKVTDQGADVVGVGRVHQSLGDMQAGAIADIPGVVANCEKALTEAERMAEVSAKSAVIGIAGELVKGSTTTISVRRADSNKQITVDELNRIIETVQKRALEKAKKQLTLEVGGKEIEVKPVNSALIGINIDGYDVTNPVDFQGKVVTVHLYNAFAPLIHIGAIEKSAQQLDLELLGVAAEPFAVARSVTGNNSDATLSAILIDIGGGTTDIAIVKDGGVEGTIMYGIGGRAFTRSIERDLATDYDTAEHYKLSIGTSHEVSKKVELVKNALQKTLKVWLSGLQLALSEFSSLDHLPSHILLCGGGSSLKMLQETLEQSDWYTTLPFTKRPQVQLIQPEQALGIVDKTAQLHDHTFITALGLARVGLDCLGRFNDSATVGIKQRINKILSV